MKDDTQLHWMVCHIQSEPTSHYASFGDARSHHRVLTSSQHWPLPEVILFIGSLPLSLSRWFDLRYEDLMKSPGKQRPRVGGPLQASVLGEAPAHVPPLPGEAPARGHQPWVCSHPRRRGLLGTSSVSSASCRCRRLVVSYVTLCSVCRRDWESLWLPPRGEASASGREFSKCRTTLLWCGEAAVN